MASAAPILGQMLVGTAISKIGENQGWHPMFTAGLGILGGAGVGSAISGGVAASAAQSAGSLAGSTAMSVNPHAGFGIADIARTRLPYGMSATPHVGMGVLNRPSGILPTATGGLSGAFASGYHGPAEMVDLPVNSRIGMKGNYFSPVGSGAPTYMNKSQQWGTLAADGAKQAWKNTWKDENFIKSLGTTMIDGMFAEQPRKQPIGGGGGGGGGSMAPAYSAGGAGQGQYKMIQSFPERGTSIQWNEVA